MKAATSLGLAVFTMWSVTAGSAAAEMSSGALALGGNWQTVCLPFGKNGRHGLIVSLSVPEDTARSGAGPFRALAQIFAKPDCAIPTVEAVYDGKAALTEDALGQVEVDQEVGTVTLTPKSSDVVEFYNAKPEEMGCGLTGWQLNQPRDVSGKTCSLTAFPAAGSQIYDRAWVEGGTLQFGAFPLKWDLTDPAQRPTRRGPVVFERVRD